MVSRVFRIPFQGGGVAPEKGILNMSDTILYVFDIMAANQLCVPGIQNNPHRAANEEWHVYVITFPIMNLFLT